MILSILAAVMVVSPLMSEVGPFVVSAYVSLPDGCRVEIFELGVGIMVDGAGLLIVDY